MKLLLAELLNLDGIEVTEYHNFDREIIMEIEMNDTFATERKIPTLVRGGEQGTVIMK